MDNIYSRYSRFRNSITRGTLDWVNCIREANGLLPLADLPKGQRNSCDSCPVAKALLSPDVGSTVATLPNGDEVALPEVVKTFMGSFDQGGYSEYWYGYGVS
jgi:hypothetical protein